MSSDVEFKLGETLADFEEGRKLFREYVDSLNFKLDFQDFEEELEHIQEKYASPEGALILCIANNQAIGCVAVRKISNPIAELKRLYVKPEFRSVKAGGKLVGLALEQAKILGYEFIRLDSVSEMQTAISLYKKLGFYEIDAYCYNPIESAVYMEKRL